MQYYGYAGKILYVDLTSGVIKKEPLDTELAQKFIGGWGLNIRLAWDLIKPGADPLSADSPIIVGAGPLVGTLAPGSAKLATTMKRAVPASKHERKFSVATSVGGSNRFGIMLKHAGYDHVVITGQAAKPCYLKIIDDDVEICEASELWGKDVYETSDELASKYRGPAGECGVWAIGRSGENLVNWAMALIDKGNTLGRFGGAVFGSKKLKAVITLGSKGIRVAQPKRFMALVNEVYQEIEEDPSLQAVPYFAGGGTITEDYPPEVHYATVGRPAACSSCLHSCRQVHIIKDGRFAGTYTPRVFFGIIRDFGRRLRLKDYREAMKLTDVICRNGLDLLTCMKMLHFLTRLYERGALSTQETGGLVLKRDFETYVDLVEKITNREGIGDTMAEGWFALAEKLGVDAAEDFRDGTPITKGIDTITDARMGGLQPVNFSIMVGDGKGHQVYSATFFPRTEDLNQDGYPEARRSLNEVRRGEINAGMTEEEMARVFTPSDFNTGRLTKHDEDAQAVYDSLGSCSSGYNLGWPMGFKKGRLAEFYSAATGFEVSPPELKKRGERAWNMERLLSVREGFTRQDDEPPASWVQNVEIPLKIGGMESYLSDWFGRHLSKEDIEKMLDDYYEERGWDTKTGVPTKEKLTELGLEDLPAWSM